MSDRYRILAVDDQEDILELIRITLDPKYDVMTLSNPMDLFEIMDVFEPDLLILDVMMPKITGYQLIEMLRRNAATKDMPIIVLSAKSTAGEIKHGYKLGATMYLTKPFQPERLLKNLETQFQISPTLNRKKSHPVEHVAAQVELKNSFRKGFVKLSSSIIKKDVVVDARKKMEEKILREEKEAKAANRDWKV